MPFEPVVIDVDGDGEVDVDYYREIGVIGNNPWPTKEVGFVAVGKSTVRLLRAKGTQLNFPLGQMVSAANAVEFNSSGFSAVVANDYYTIDFSGSFTCDYIDNPRSWNALTNGIAGIRLQSDDGFHYGWIRFARPDLEPSTPFAVVDHDWNPVPGAPIGAGEPPALPALQTQLGETGLTLTWDARFPNLQLEWAESLSEPVDWHHVEDAGAGTALLPPAETNRFFRLRKL